MKIFQALTTITMLIVCTHGHETYSGITVTNGLNTDGCMQPVSRDPKPGYLMTLQTCDGGDSQKFDIRVSDTNDYYQNSFQIRKTIGGVDLCAFLRKTNIFEPRGILRMDACEDVFSRFFTDFFYDENPSHFGVLDKTITPVDAYGVDYCLTGRGRDQDIGENIIAFDVSAYGRKSPSRPRFSWDFGADDSDTVDALLEDLAHHA